MTVGSETDRFPELSYRTAPQAKNVSFRVSERLHQQNIKEEIEKNTLCTLQVIIFAGMGAKTQAHTCVYTSTTHIHK